MLLLSVRFGVTTSTLPEVAPVGTVAVIWVADDRERRRQAAKGDGGRARQIVAQDLNRRSHLAGVGQQFDKRPKHHRQGEEGPIPAGSAADGHPVEETVRSLNYAGTTRSIRTAEAVESFENPLPVSLKTVPAFLASPGRLAAAS